jgi:hypothetical protein
VAPRIAIVQVTSFDPKSAGTFTAKTPQWRPGWNSVGCPWFGGPGSTRLAAPIGTLTTSSALRL